MDKLQLAINSYNKLIGKEIKLVIGRKGKKSNIYIDFYIEDFYHLIGYHHLKDLTSISRLSAKIAFRKTINGKITLDMLKKSVYFNDIEDRIDCIILFYKMFSDSNLVFKFRSNSFGKKFSKIKWNYLILFPTNNLNGYLFLQEIRKKPGHFACISTFENVGYEKNHIRYVVLEAYLVNGNQEKELYIRKQK